MRIDPEIVRYGNDILRKPAEKVVSFNEDIKQLIHQMYEIMKAHNGLGLAANQIGVDLQIFTYDIGEGPHAVINPKIIRSKGEEVGVEGCLSIPGIQGDVPRAEEVVLKGLDENGKPVRIKAKGLLARVFQHETDHLNGYLFIDRADPETLYQVTQNGGEDSENENEG